MISKSIYTPINPTYLYIKQHSITGLKYFGKTTQNPYTYQGSGIRWNNHIKKHGKQFVKTIWVSELYYDTSIVEHALHFSEKNNIVESDNWANLIPENGLDGGFNMKNKKHTEKSKLKMSIGNTGKIRTQDHKNKISIGNKNKIKTEKSKIKFKQTCFEKYGVENPSQNETIKQKKKDTSKQNWGVENTLQSTIVKEKSKLTLLEKYGVDNVSKSVEIKQKKKIKAQKKYGVDNVFQSEEIKERIKQSNREKYGVDNPAKLPFLSIIDCKRTFNKSTISRYYPELKQYY